MKMVAIMDPRPKKKAIIMYSLIPHHNYGSLKIAIIIDPRKRHNCGSIRNIKNNGSMKIFIIWIDENRHNYG